MNESVVYRQPIGATSGDRTHTLFAQTMGYVAATARACFWALVALIVFGVVLIFVHIPDGALFYSVLGLVIFAGFTMFDFQLLRTTKDITSAPFLAASIFLDILNVFLLLLTIFSSQEQS